jgi:hypothetical protein
LPAVVICSITSTLWRGVHAIPTDFGYGVPSLPVAKMASLRLLPRLNFTGERRADRGALRGRHTRPPEAPQTRARQHGLAAPIPQTSRRCN